MEILQVYGQIAIRAKTSDGQNLLLVDKGIGFGKRKGDQAVRKSSTQVFIEKTLDKNI